MKRPSEHSSAAGEHGRASKLLRDDRFSALSPSVRDYLSVLFKTGLCEPEDVDERAIGQLKELSDSDAQVVLDQFRDAGLETVRNKSAYLCSVMKRFRIANGKDQERRTGLTQQSKKTLAALEKQGVFDRDTLDDRCLQTLSTLTESCQAAVLHDFANRELSDVRNLSAFFMAVIKKQEKARHDSRRDRGRRRSESPVTNIPSGAGGRSYEVHLPIAAPLLDSTRIPLGPPGVSTASAVVPGAPARQHHGLEQLKWGVRVDEFHSLSVYAPHVHPAAALKLQQLWDSGVKLLSMLDDRSWETLADLNAACALQVVEEVAEKLKYAPDDLLSVNTFFMATAGKYPKASAATTPATHVPMVPARAIQAAQPLPAAPGGLHAIPPSLIPASSQLPLGGGYAPPVSSYAPLSSLPAAAPLLTQLPQRIQMKIEQLVARSNGHLTLDHFDSGLIEVLRGLSEKQQGSVLDEVKRNDLGSVRNPTAYIMGIVRRYERGGRERGGHRRR